MAHHKNDSAYPKLLHSRYNWNLTVTVSNPEQEAALPFEFKTADIECETNVPATLSGSFQVGGTVTASLPSGIVGTIEFIRTTKTIPPVKSPILGASANNVNALNYVVQQVDAGNTLGVETSNTTVAPVGVDIPSGPGPVIGLPTAPQNVVATAGNGTATVSWSAPAQLNNGTLLGYNVVRSPATSLPIAVQSPSAGSYVDSTASNGVSYTYSVSATTNGGTGPAATSNSVTPSNVVAPAKISEAAFSGTPTQGTPLVITAATFSGTPTPTVTRVIRMDGAQVASGNTSTTYTPVAGDVGKIPSVTDTATNTAGTASSTASGAAVVAAAVAQARQAAIGNFVGETLNQTNYWYGASLPFTNQVAAAAGSDVVIEFANKSVINGIETNGTGVFVIDDLGLEIAGTVYPAVLTKARAENATETAVATVTLPVALPAGEFRLNYRIHDSGGAKCFPHWAHTSTSPTRQVFQSSLPSAQTMVPGGGTWPLIAAAAAADVVVPTAIKIRHAGKILCVGGSSSGVGRADSTLGSGVQGYLQRLAKDQGVPVLTTAVSGRRAAQLASNDAWLTSLMVAGGATHYALVVGGNDINFDAATAAQVIANINTHVNRVKSAIPGLKVMIVCLTPVVSGTYDTLAGQTPNGTTSIRLDANSQIRAGAITGADSVFDVTVQVETQQKFRVDLGGQITFDGLHVNGRGCGFIQSDSTAIAAMTSFLAK